MKFNNSREAIYTDLDISYLRKELNNIIDFYISFCHFIRI